MKSISSWLLILLLFLSACDQTEEPKPDTTGTEPITYLALGDSYTIGTGVTASERYPVQLADTLEDMGYSMTDPQIIARVGWTTLALQNALDTAQLTPPYDLVSLLIGVNNQYQGAPISQYEIDFEVLLDQAIELAGNDKDRVFVLSIPDYAYTPFGQAQNPANISQEIDAFNEVNKTITEAKGVQYFNITPISRMGLDMPDLVATDKLHPSGKMYNLWIEQILGDVEEKIQ